MRRVICWGTGNAAEAVFKYSKREDVEIPFICTNDFNQWGEDFYGYNVCSPLKILDVEYDLILILCGSPRTNFEVYEQLISMGVNKERILSIGDYKLIEYCPNAADDYFMINKAVFPSTYEKKVVVESGYHGETYKAHERRMREGFFEKFCKGEGLDIGYGGDPITPDCFGWDIQDGDAQYMASIPDESFDYVYSSHCLEHMRDVSVALKNWFRIVRNNGYLIIYIPERDLYEKKKELPSRFNADHKHMFLLGVEDEPDTLDIKKVIKESLNGYDIIYAKICNEGHTLYFPNVKSDGEYSIEIVIKRIE